MLRSQDPQFKTYKLKTRWFQTHEMFSTKKFYLKQQKINDHFPNKNFILPNIKLILPNKNLILPNIKMILSHEFFY